MIAEIHQLRAKPIASNWMCSACGVDASCNCGAALMSKAKRAAEAVAANPQKSNRSIADDLGISEGTVRTARQSGAQDYAPDESETRTGKDGKRYPVLRRAVEDDDPPYDRITEVPHPYDADHEEGLRIIAARGFLNRAIEAKQMATVDKLRAADVTQATIKAADDAAAAWTKAAQNLRGMINV